MRFLYNGEEDEIGQLTFIHEDSAAAIGLNDFGGKFLTIFIKDEEEYYKIKKVLNLLKEAYNWN